MNLKIKTAIKIFYEIYTVFDCFNDLLSKLYAYKLLTQCCKGGLGDSCGLLGV